MPKFEAKDYTRVDGPGQQTITSLAHWLTPEGINPITAELVQKAIEEDDDAEFAEAFDGASKDDARGFLEKWELCYMPYWSGAEVAFAIKLCGGRNEALALRAITLAQQAGELPQAFTPRQGVEWAKARGYLIDGDICQLAGAQPGEYGHPHNQLEQRAPVDKPVATAQTISRKNKVQARSQAPITAEIRCAKANAVDAADATSVWAELVKLAEAKFGCLLGADEDTIKYQDGEMVLHFKKRSLRERMRRERNKK